MLTFILWVIGISLFIAAFEGFVRLAIVLVFLGILGLVAILSLGSFFWIHDQIGWGGIGLISLVLMFVPDVYKLLFKRTNQPS